MAGTAYQTINVENTINIPTQFFVHTPFSEHDHVMILPQYAGGFGACVTGAAGALAYVHATGMNRRMRLSLRVQEHEEWLQGRSTPFHDTVAVHFRS
ncbi:hypothetical protein [Komagataeibacter nataicola]|nr:hypothetical protein [Komagataeibacter nataicola]